MIIKCLKNGGNTRKEHTDSHRLDNTENRNYISVKSRVGDIKIMVLLPRESPRVGIMNMNMIQNTKETVLIFDQDTDKTQEFIQIHQEDLMEVKQ